MAKKEELKTKDDPTTEVDEVKPDDDPSTDLEDVHQPTSAGANSSGASNACNRKKWLIAGAFVAVVFAIVFSVSWTLTRGSDKNDEAVVKTRTFAETVGPYNATLNLFTEDITKGYATVDELKQVSPNSLCYSHISLFFRFHSFDSQRRLSQFLFFAGPGGNRY